MLNTLHLDLDGPVDLYITPTIAREGVDKVILTCNASNGNDGDDQMKYVHQWFKNDQVINGSSESES